MGATKIINVLKDDSFDEVLSAFKQAQAEEVILVLPKKTKAFKSETSFASLSEAAQQDGKRISVLCSNPDVRDLSRQYGFGVLAERGSASTPRSAKKIQATLTTSPISNGDDEYNVDVSDDSDAYERDVVIPSDEKMDVESPEEDGEEFSRMHEENNEGADVERGVKEDKDELVDEDLLADKQKKIEDEEITAEDAVADYEQPVAQGAVAYADKTLDGFVKRQPHSEKTLRIKSSPERPTKLGIRSVERKELEDLARVWRREGQREEGIWGDLRKSRKPWWGGIASLFSSLNSSFSNKRKREMTFMSRVSFPSMRKARLIIALGGGLLAIGTLVFFTTDGSAQIILKPVSKKLDLRLQVSASDQFSSIDSTFSKIPGQRFNIERTVSKEFSATGQKEVAQKARGIITVYNAYGTAAQTLIATTRFQSARGLIFRTLRSVLVPGTTVENGVVTPGQVSVEVIAEKPGKEYNIEPGDFAIPAFKERADTGRYEKITGKSTIAMQGGITGLAKVVTEADYASARDAVLKQLEIDISKTLNDQVGKLETVASISYALKSITSTAQPDQAAETFTVSASGILNTIAFQHDDLLSLLKAYGEKNYDVVVIPDQLSVSYAGSHMDESKGILQLTVSAEGSGYSKIPEGKIIEDLLGKKEQEIREYLKTASGVASARVVLSPFWITRIPKEQADVTVKIEYQP